MPSWLALALLAAAVAAILLGLRRSLVVFQIRAAEGRIVLARGHLPAELLGEITDVVQRERLSGRIEARSQGGGLALVTSAEIARPAAQRLRNVVGRFSPQRIKSAPRR
jgi:hypothetical protein